MVIPRRLFQFRKIIVSLIHTINVSVRVRIFLDSFSFMSSIMLSNRLDCFPTYATATSRYVVKVRHQPNQGYHKHNKHDKNKYKVDYCYSPFLLLHQYFYQRVGVVRCVQSHQNNREHNQSPVSRISPSSCFNIISTSHKPYLQAPMSSPKRTRF